MSAAADAARAKLTARELAALRVELGRELRAELAASKRPARVRVRELPEIASGARRLLRAVGTRAAADPAGLPELVALRDQLDDLMAEAVAAARAQAVPYSWAELGGILGVTKQAAQQRFGAPRATRRTA